MQTRPLEDYPALLIAAAVEGGAMLAAFCVFALWVGILTGKI